MADYSSEIIHYQKCVCGAITICHVNGAHYSFLPKNKRTLLPGLDLRKIKKLGQTASNCNHCVNKWGLDLCACGSGEDFRRCENHFSECGHPMQEYGGHISVAASDAW